ncbi:hypothetical protein [Endozoicomonas elysicola]|uniref:SH3b domain-containing protein n=1 Tax=Endozoicomonas elysicola TaxID=305900 RepID=A0A081KBJ6_9GAMM|nr:hypothetical protein [Endozoicomonas elysicola]KEI71522.1 hypothetical protein GV64_12930 [Endozoicomonas elysicola]
MSHGMSTNIRIWPLFVLMLLSSGSFASDSYIKQELAHIRDLHQQALELSISHPTRGKREHVRVAGMLESFWDHPLIDKGALAYSVGNSWFHAGRYGESILWYRRAEGLGYNHAELAQNLDYVRSKRLDELPEAFGAQWLSEMDQWASHPLWVLLSVAVYLWFWWQLVSYIREGRTRRLSLVFSTVALFIVGSGFVFSNIYEAPGSDGVITVTNTTARKGPGLIFSPAFTSPLNQGTEVIVLEKQKNWLRVLLSNDAQVWLPEDSLSFIHLK